MGRRVRIRYHCSACGSGLGEVYGQPRFINGVAQCPNCRAVMRDPSYQDWSWMAPWQRVTFVLAWIVVMPAFFTGLAAAAAGFLRWTTFAGERGLFHWVGDKIHKPWDAAATFWVVAGTFALAMSGCGWVYLAVRIGNAEDVPADDSHVRQAIADFQQEQRRNQG